MSCKRGCTSTCAKRPNLDGDRHHNARCLEGPCGISQRKTTLRDQTARAGGTQTARAGGTQTARAGCGPAHGHDRDECSQCRSYAKHTAAAAAGWATGGAGGAAGGAGGAAGGAGARRKRAASLRVGTTPGSLVTSNRFARVMTATVPPALRTNRLASTNGSPNARDDGRTGTSPTPRRPQ